RRWSTMRTRIGGISSTACCSALRHFPTATATFASEPRSATDPRHPEGVSDARMTLLRPQREHWIDATRATSRQPGRDHRHRHEAPGGRDEGARVVDAHAENERLRRAHSEQRRTKPDRHTDERENATLTEDELQHAPAVGAEGEANADLARAVRDEMREQSV